jgi:hypothetical protein
MSSFLEDDITKQVEDLPDLTAHSRLIQFSPHLTSEAQDEGNSPDGVEPPQSPTYPRRLSENWRDNKAKTEVRRPYLNRPLSFDQVHKVVEMLKPKPLPTEKDKKKQKKLKKHRKSANANVNWQEDSLDLSQALLSFDDDTLPCLKSENIKPEAIPPSTRSAKTNWQEDSFDLSPALLSFDDDTLPCLKSKDIKPEAIPPSNRSVNPRIETCKKRPLRKYDATIVSAHASFETIDPRILSSLVFQDADSPAGKCGSDESLLTGSSEKRFIPISPITPPEEVLEMSRQGTKKAFVGVSVKEAPSLRRIPMPGFDEESGSPARFKLRQKPGNAVSRSASTYNGTGHFSGLSINFENLSKHVDPGTPDASPTSPWIKMKYDLENASFKLPKIPKKVPGFDSPPEADDSGESLASLTVDDLASTMESIENSHATGTSAAASDGASYQDSMAEYIEIDSIRELLMSEVGALFQDILPSIVDHRPESERDYLKETLKVDMRQLLDQFFATGTRRTTQAAFDDEADAKPPAKPQQKTITPRLKNLGFDKSSV